MAENKNVDEYLYEACRQEKENLLSLGPDFQKIEKEALAKFKLRKKTRVRKIVIQAVAAVAAIFIIVNGVVIISDVPEVMAYRNTVRKFYFNFVNNDSEQDNEKVPKYIEDAQQTVPFKIPYPHWLPAGYEMAEASADTDGLGTYYVEIIHNRSNADKRNAIQINITNETYITTPSVGEPPVEVKDIAGYKVYIKANGDNPEIGFNCMFFYDDLCVTLTGPFDIAVFTQILESFKT